MTPCEIDWKQREIIWQKRFCWYKLDYTECTWYRWLKLCHAHLIKEGKYLFFVLYVFRYGTGKKPSKKWSMSLSFRIPRGNNPSKGQQSKNIFLTSEDSTGHSYFENCLKFLENKDFRIRRRNKINYCKGSGWKSFYAKNTKIK